MNIIFILTQDLLSPSGRGRYFPIARELVKAGHKAKIITLHSNYKNTINKQLIDGIEVNYVAPMHVKKIGNYKSYYRTDELLFLVFKATIELSKAALLNKSDVIIIGKPHPMNSIAGLLTKFIHHTPIILDCDDYEAGSNRFSGKWQRMIIKFFEKSVPKLSDAITTHTHYMISNLISWGVDPKKITYLPNGVDPSSFIKPDDDKIKKTIGNLNIQDKKVISYIGSLSLPSHPIDILLKSFSQLRHDFPETILMIVGGGEDLEFLKKQAQDLNISNYIRFVGRVNPDDIALYYFISDITVDPVYDNPAAHGRSPLKLFESWVCGIPFVSADVGERALLLGNPAAGVLVFPNKIEALTKGLASILQNDQFSSNLITRGKDRVKDYYWENIIKILERLIISYAKDNNLKNVDNL